jgi:tetratricopeptide (TPR) repeat protein
MEDIMKNVNLQKLEDKAGKMAMDNIWGEYAYKINMAILKIDSNNCNAYTRLAKYYKINDNIAEAKNMYLKTLYIDPKNWGAINNLNDIEVDQKESDAVDKIKTTGELLKQGQSSMLKGKYNLAAKLFSRAYSKEPLLMHAFSLAGAYKKVGKYDRIEKLYTQLIGDNRIQEDVDAINNEFKMYRLNEKSLTGRQISS